MLTCPREAVLVGLVSDGTVFWVGCKIVFGVDADDLAMVNLNLKETRSIELANFRYWSKQASFNVICTD